MQNLFVSRLLIIWVFIFTLNINAYAQENIINVNEALQQSLPCANEKISIAAMQWPSASILANIHAQILEKEYRCETQVIMGDLSATISSMATTGQPLIAPEMWVTRIAKIYNLAIENQKIRKGGQAFSGTALEGWFMPQSVAKNHPDLKLASQLKDYWSVFRGEGQKARFISCPKEWACATINKNMLKALGLADRFEIIEPIDRFEMDSMIGAAVSKNEPTLFYYWQPNAILTQFNFLQLDMGSFNQEAFTCLAKSNCKMPIFSAFAPEPVVNILAESVFVNIPKIASYFLYAQMPIDKMNETLAWQSENNLSAKDAATWFVEQNEEVWKTWIEN